MKRPIHPGLAPNITWKDFVISLKEIFSPWQYKRGNDTKKLEQWFEKKYSSSAFAFASGRGALFAVLKNLGVQAGDEVLVTGFTCVAVVDAILACDATPIYVDIDARFQLDRKDLIKKITKKAKVLIVQHTFGIPMDIRPIADVIKKHKLLLVEDVAHGIGIKDAKTLLGTQGIAGVFSFGRDKAFSCVSGGMVITNKKVLANQLQEFQKNQNESSYLWVFQNLFHTVSFYSLILPFYDFLSFGKFLLVLLQKIGFLAKPIDAKELQHFQQYAAQLAPALSRVAYAQVQRLEDFNAHREKYTTLYQSLLKRAYPKMLQIHQPLLRFPLLVENPHRLKKIARQNNVYLGDWYSNVIDPKGTNKEKLLYQSGSCPNAEYTAAHIVNLPTYPTLSREDGEKVATIVLSYAQHTTNHA